jgi:THO complex subunit 3
MDSQIDDSNDEGKVIYDWSPPTGQKQDFFYKGSRINRDQVT